PSLHQNSQPISQGTYSASKFIRSRTILAASITSLPTPSPGIHAILYLAIDVDLNGASSSRKQVNFRTADYAHDADQTNRRKQRKRRCRYSNTNLCCLRYLLFKICSREAARRPAFRRRRRRSISARQD